VSDFRPFAGLSRVVARLMLSLGRDSVEEAGRLQVAENRRSELARGAAGAIGPTLLVDRDAARALLKCALS
jgi:hypothetical protein